MRGSGIPVVPTISNHGFNFGADSDQTIELEDHATFRRELLRLLEVKSTFRNDEGTVEGVVLRLENENVSPWLKEKFKIVRPDFVRGCSNGHWSTRRVEKQRVDFEFAETYLQVCYTRAGNMGVDTDEVAPKSGY